MRELQSGPEGKVKTGMALEVYIPFAYIGIVIIGGLVAFFDSEFYQVDFYLVTDPFSAFLL